MVFSKGGIRMKGRRSVIAFLIGFGLTLPATATTLQERIEAAVPGETIYLEARVHHGPIIIDRPIALVGEAGAEIRGNGTGSVVTITADDVTVRGLRVAGSGI